MLHEIVPFCRSKTLPILRLCAQLCKIICQRLGYRIEWDGEISVIERLSLIPAFFLHINVKNSGLISVCLNLFEALYPQQRISST